MDLERLRIKSKTWFFEQLDWEWWQGKVKDFNTLSNECYLSEEKEPNALLIDFNSGRKL